MGHSLTFCSTFAVLVLCLLAVFEKDVVEATSGGKKRLCGKSLIKEVNQVCTPEGYSVQCFHRSQRGHYMDIDRKNRLKRSVDEEQRFKDFMQNFGFIEELRAANSRKKRGSRISHTCCQDGCDAEYLETFCCDDNEFAEFKKLHSPSK